MEYDYDTTIIGAGPGGYVAAIRAAQLGLKTLLVEKDKPGGVCLNVGCIPSKALIHQADLLHNLDALRELGVKADTAALDYSKAYAKSRQAADSLSKGVQYLVKKNGIDYKKGTAFVKRPHSLEIDGKETITTRTIILATGSSPKELPGLPFDETRILSSTGALMMERLPERIAILGAGAIGIELAYVWNAFGAAVHIIEAQERILPLEDSEAAALVARSFKQRGIQISVGSTVAKVEAQKDRIVLQLRGEAAQSVECDALLVAIGRTPNSAGLGLDNIGIRTERGFVSVGPYGQTAAESVYAIGDLVNSPLLAHVASKEGELAVEHIAHTIKGAPLPSHSSVQPDLIPSAVYCSPEVASFGLSETTAKKQGLPYKAYSFPYKAIGKAVATGSSQGFIKILANPSSEEILGATIVGERATDLIHELILARQAELTVSEIADMMHAHPTLAEGIMEAAKGLLGRAVHF